MATPQTLKHYLGIPGGAVYGFDQDVTDSWLFRDSDLKPNVPGLRGQRVDHLGRVQRDDRGSGPLLPATPPTLGSGSTEPQTQ